MKPILNFLQSASVAVLLAVTMSMLLCPGEMIGKGYPVALAVVGEWIFPGCILVALISSLVLALTGSLKRGQVGLLLTFGSLLIGALLAH